MKNLELYSAVIALLLLMLCGCSAISRNHGKDLSIFGKSFTYDYGGFKPSVFYSEADKTITWHIGDRSETDPIFYKKLGHGRYFVTWKEKDGTVVTQHIDLIEMKVHSSLLIKSKKDILHLMEGRITGPN